MSKQRSTNGRERRPRTRISPHQLTLLEEAFKHNQYINRVDRYNLARNIDLEENVVKIWFQNRRMKNKKTKKTEDKSVKVNEKNSAVTYPPNPVQEVGACQQQPLTAHQQQYNSLLHSSTYNHLTGYENVVATINRPTCRNDILTPQQEHFLNWQQAKQYGQYEQVQQEPSQMPINCNNRLQGSALSEHTAYVPIQSDPFCASYNCNTYLQL